MPNPFSNVVKNMTQPTGDYRNYNKQFQQKDRIKGIVNNAITQSGGPKGSFLSDAPTPNTGGGTSNTQNNNVAQNTLAPADLSGFTSGQQAAFDAANQLGTGVQTTGRTTPPLYSNVNASISPNINQPPTPNQPPQTQYSGIIQGLQTAGQSNAGVEAYNARANEIAGERRGLQTDLATKLGDLYSTPSTVGFGLGRVNQLAQLGAAKDTALSQELEALSAQQGILQEGQRIETGALASAGQLAQPSTAQYGQTVFNPLTGQYEGGQGNLNPQTQATDLAQSVMSGQMTYDQALASIGYAGQAGTAFLNQAITGAGGNPLQLQATGAAQQNITGTRATAQTDIARQGLQTATQEYVQMTNFAGVAKEQADAVLNILNMGDINGTPLVRLNKSIKAIAREASNPEIARLDVAVQEARGFYTNLLSTGGSTPTTNDQRALDTLNADATPQAIAASLHELEAAAARRLQGQESMVQNYQSVLNGEQSGGQNDDPLGLR